MLFSLVYLLLRPVMWLAARSSGELMDAEGELVVLRHQLNVLAPRVACVMPCLTRLAPTG